MGDTSTAKGVFTSIMEGPAWYGDAVLTIVDGVSPEQASSRPRSQDHSIWEYLLHMTAWQHYAIRALEGERVEEELPDDVNWPALGDESEEAWEEARRVFRKGATRFSELLDGWSDEGFRETVTGRDFSYKVLVHGVAHHNVYHAGQIALVKKWVS